MAEVGTIPRGNGGPGQANTETPRRDGAYSASASLASSTDLTIAAMKVFLKQTTNAASMFYRIVVPLLHVASWAKYLQVPRPTCPTLCNWSDVVDVILSFDIGSARCALVLLGLHQSKNILLSVRPSSPSNPRTSNAASHTTVHSTPFNVKKVFFHCVSAAFFNITPVLFFCPVNFARFAIRP